MENLILTPKQAADQIWPLGNSLLATPWSSTSPWILCPHSLWGCKESDSTERLKLSQVIHLIAG